MKKNYRLEAAQLVRQTTRRQHGSSLRMSSLSGAIDNRQPPPTPAEFARFIRMKTRLVASGSKATRA